MLEASHSTAPQRVKVYRLNNEGKWDDKGTGHVTIQLLEVGVGDGALPSTHQCALCVAIRIFALHAPAM